MTKLLSGEEFLQLVARKDTKVFAVNVKGSQYKVDYESTRPIAGNVSAIMERVLRNIPNQPKDIRPGNQVELCASLEGNKLGIPDNGTEIGKGNRSMETGNHPTDENLAQSKTVSEYLDTGAGSNGSKSDREADSQQGTGRSAEPEKADTWSDRTYRTTPEPERSRPVVPVESKGKGTQDHAGPAVLVKHYDTMNGHMQIPEDIYNALNGLFAVCQQKKADWIKRKMEQRKA